MANGLTFRSLLLAAISASTPAYSFTPLLCFDGAVDGQVREAVIAANYPVLFGVDPQGETDPAGVPWPEDTNERALRLAAVIRSFGYLDARVAVTPSGDAAAVGPGVECRQDQPGADAPWRYLVSQGPLYRVGQVEVQGLERSIDAALSADLAAFIARFPGDTATASELSRIENDVVRRVSPGPYGLAMATAKSVEIDRDYLTAAVRLRIDLGEPQRFGRIYFRGLRRISDDEALALATFREGDAYNRPSMELYARRLQSTGWFQRVRVDHADQPDASGLLPVEVSVRETEPDIEYLETSGVQGMIAGTVALFVLAIGQVATAGRAPVQWVRRLNFIGIVVVVYAVALALLRVESFLQRP